MDLTSILADSSVVQPRRTSSNPPSIAAASPATSVAKLPSPPLSTRPTRKRKRHDPKPIWAVLEDEQADLPTNGHTEQRQPARPPQTSVARPQPPPVPIYSNGPAPPHAARPPMGATARELTGWQRPITDDPFVYDEMVRRTCDFIWNHVVEDRALRTAVDQSPGAEIEIEARWGQIIDLNTGRRLASVNETECVIRQDAAAGTKFESTMSLMQHRKMNEFLNEQVGKSKITPSRTDINYKHTKEVDMFYDLDQTGFELLVPAMREIIARQQHRQRIRVTRDMKTGQVIRKIIKVRIANLEISSPLTEWDYRIGINIEIEFPGPVEPLTPVIDRDRNLEDMERKKDRMSYSWLSAYQIDLTQVVQGKNKNHELELELDARTLLKATEKVNSQDPPPNDYEALVAGMLNNLRVLSREMTP